MPARRVEKSVPAMWESPADAFHICKFCAASVRMFIRFERCRKAAAGAAPSDPADAPVSILAIIIHRSAPGTILRRGVSVIADTCFVVVGGWKLTKYIRIGIGDKNDNPPYFGQALYEAEVNEDEDVQHTVITVTAKDKDESGGGRLLENRTVYRFRNPARMLSSFSLPSPSDPG
ncbi:hypothetical protein HPB52_018239 [Rhipicephalus sanguineus]|uniref:Uncharacterized protein n=1 Tax=Rhipicephalus sanguineus TaxID=34632 RepID=A0A9D4YQG6_RHISA|nr:hypothetical protein HPB52_018239 [Rhipicephalus sanguineus]